MHRHSLIVIAFAASAVVASVTFGNSHALYDPLPQNNRSVVVRDTSDNARTREVEMDNPFHVAIDEISVIKDDSSSESVEVTTDSFAETNVVGLQLTQSSSIWSGFDGLDFREPVSDHLSARYAEIESWALENPQYALEWVTTTASVEEQQAFELLIVHTLLPSNEEMVYEYRDYLTRNDSQSIVDRSYARALAETDPLAAFEWADALADEESRLAALSVVVTRWAVVDHQHTLDRIAMIEDKPVQKHLFTKVANTIAADLVTRNPADALNWIETLAEDQKQIALPAVFSSWIARDPDEARTWLRELPATVAKEEMIERDFWYSVEADVEHALAIYSELPSETASRSDYVYSLAFSVSSQRPALTESLLVSLSASQIEVAKNAARDQLMFSDPEAYLNLYGSLGAEDKTRHLISVLTTLEYREPELVSRWLHSRVSDAEVSRARRSIEEFSHADYPLD